MNDCLKEIGEGINSLAGKTIELEPAECNYEQQPNNANYLSLQPQADIYEQLKLQSQQTFQYTPAVSIKNSEEIYEAEPWVYDVMKNGVPKLYYNTAKYNNSNETLCYMDKFSPKNKSGQKIVYKPIANMFISSCKYCGDIYIANISYMDEKGFHETKETIPKECCHNDKICQYLKSKGINCFVLGVSDKLISQCIFALLRQKAIEGCSIPKSPGFGYYEGRYEFVSNEFCEKNSIPPVGVLFDIEPKTSNKEAVNKFLSLANRHTDIMQFILLNLLRICGLLTTPMLECGIKFTKIVVINGSADIINLHLQIYNRNIEFNRMLNINASTNTFGKMIKGKDCVLTFKDDNAATKYISDNGIQNIKTLSDMMLSQLSFEIESGITEFPFICCIVSDKLALHLSGKEVLTVNMDNIISDSEPNQDMGNNIPEGYKLELMKTLYEIDKLIIKEVTGNKEKIFELWKNKLNEYFGKYEFKYSQSNMAFMALMTAFFMLNRVIKDYAELPFSTEDMEDYLFNIIDKSEKIDNMNTIVNEFIANVNEQVISEKLIILSNKDISPEISLTKGKPIVYLDDGYLYFTDDIFEEITSSLTLANNPCNLRKHLKSNKLLKPNDDLKYKVILPDIGRDLVTAVKSSILTEEAEMHIKSNDRNFDLCCDDGRIERISVGNDMNGKPVYWSIGHSDLTSRHLMIVGKTGSGKSFAMNLIAKELYTKGHKIVYVNYKRKNVRKELAEHAFGYDFVDKNVTIFDIEKVNSGEISLSEIFKEDKIIAFTAAGYSVEIEKLLGDIFDYVLNNEELNIILLIDEVHQLEYKKNAPIYNIMYKARDVGISLISAFQSFNQMKPAHCAMLCQAPVKMFFMMDNEYDQDIAARKFTYRNKYASYKNLIKTLKKRHCIVAGALEDNNGEIAEQRFIQIEIPEIKDNAQTN